MSPDGISPDRSISRSPGGDKKYLKGTKNYQRSLKGINHCQRHYEHRVLSLYLVWLNWICIQFSCRDNSSFRLNTLGPLCLWQCLSICWWFPSPASGQRGVAMQHHRACHQWYCMLSRCVQVLILCITSHHFNQKLLQVVADLMLLYTSSFYVILTRPPRSR